MSDLNPNNYRGIEAVIVGYAAGNPEYPAYDKEGAKGRKQLSIPVNFGYKKDGEWVETGMIWVRYIANEEYLAGIGKGDKVRLDGAKLEVREGKDGKQYFDAQFGEVEVLESADRDF